ncbi:MAG: sugar phosphate isomerase/epimerase family protein [Pirellulaceae bacterium]|jgi:hexulose-6-phosphate isomerase|nr:sugar phosphate isomerase/epimerase family protein [Pirellulaceae bacterium]MDP6554634.1 sugar phosphate isomerase/epimerase family protein [Pirellulaceae bacterium]MDP6722789.1 sugar phosphate isomerase/epimerase family protein [Pirellulaceae bacterium]
MSQASGKEPVSSAPALGRRELLSYSAAFGAAFMARQGFCDEEIGAEPPRQSVKQRAPKRYEMKKAINMWAFAYPDQWSLKESLQLAKDAGFDGVEINFDLTGEFSAESTEAEIVAIRKLAEQIGIEISGVCSFLFWPYSMTHNDPARRKKGIELAGQMVEAARLLETENLLVVPGAVYAPWIEDFDPVPNDVCDRRAREAIRQILPAAEKAGVSINIENIFANGFLFSPQEMIDFVDGFRSKHVQVHFDTGNIMHYQFPEHWVRILGKRVKNIHFKEFDKRQNEFTLNTFRTLLDGTTNWPAVIEELDKIDYRGYLTFEYFHPFSHYPEALIYQTSDALDWMLGRKA